MHKYFLKNFIIVLIIFILNCNGFRGFKIPDVKLDITETGFVVSIPDEPGIKNVAFNVNRNRKFQSFSQGEFSAQVFKVKNGRWSYQFNRELNSDDTIHIWTNVQHNQVVYRDIAEPIKVCELLALGCELDTNEYDRLNGRETVNPTKTPVSNNEPTQEVQESNAPGWPSVLESTSSTTPQTVSGRQCPASITIVPYRRVCKGELIFEDNFDSLNASIWQHEVRAPNDNEDYEFVLYDTEAQIDNGNLKIKPTLWSNYQPNIDVLSGSLNLGRRCTGTHDRNRECRLSTGGPRTLPPVVTPRLNTKDTFSFTYGRIEIRAKLPKGEWLAPLLQLEPLLEYYGQSGYASGLLRIAFARGNEELYLASGKAIDGRVLYGGAVLFQDAERRDVFMANKRSHQHFGNEFHVYSLTWTKDSLHLMVDDQSYGVIPGGFKDTPRTDTVLLDAWKRGSYMAPFDRPFYITLGLSAGGFGDFPDNIRSGAYEKPWHNKHPRAQFRFWQQQSDWVSTWQNSELLIDYVRVYAI